MVRRKCPPPRPSSLKRGRDEEDEEERKKRTESRAKQGGTSHGTCQNSICPASLAKNEDQNKGECRRLPTSLSELSQLLLPPSPPTHQKHQKSATHFPRGMPFVILTDKRDISSQKKVHARHLFKFTNSSGNYHIKKELWRQTEGLRFPGLRQGIVYQNKDGSILSHTN